MMCPHCGEEIEIENDDYDRTDFDALREERKDNASRYCHFMIGIKISDSFLEKILDVLTLKEFKKLCVDEVYIRMKEIDDKEGLKKYFFKVCWNKIKTKEEENKENARRES